MPPARSLQSLYIRIFSLFPGVLLLCTAFVLPAGSDSLTTPFKSMFGEVKKEAPADLEGNKVKDKEKMTSGNVGAGLSMTTGNSETINWNISFGLNQKTSVGHEFQADGLYLRGKESGKLSLDRLKLSFRDDYTINESIVGFGDVAYKRDPLKGIDYLVNPSAGLGWKVFDNTRFSLKADAGTGVLIERNTGLEQTSSVSINSNQSFTCRISESARINQKLAFLWKADQLVDYLMNLSVSVAAKVTRGSELQAEFIDDFKNKPSDIAYKKNDIALILKYVVRF